MATTPLAGRAVARFGTRPTFWAALGVAALGLPLLVLPSLPGVLLGMVLVGAGTFFAQACATGFVGRAATSERGAASGLYLASYFFGGLVGAPCSGRSSICSAGGPVSPALAWRSRSRPFWRSSSRPR